jgi:hypothetical protein
VGYYIFALITSGPGTRQLGAAPMTQSLVQFFKIATPRFDYPALPFSSWGNHNKTLGQSYSLFPCLVTNLSASLNGPLCYGMPSFLETIINYILKSNYLLIYWPYYASNFLLLHYILKQLMQ